MTPPRPDRIEVFPSSHDVTRERPEPWYVRIVAPNGETLFVSEGYASKRNALRAANREADRRVPRPRVVVVEG